ncbi:MAG: nitroreductase family protein [Oscillospiraceae bacterium]|nr:nitroreductase family protein [Oscillospiraceae bacterium]
MTNKLKKGLQYLRVRFFEFRLCLKEFRKGQKLTEDAFESFYKNSLLVEVHSVEKGLGLSNTQPGHSARPVNNLLNKLFGYIDRGYDIQDFSFRETLRVIMEYVDFQKSYDTSLFPEFDEIDRKYIALCSKLGEQFVKSVRCTISAGSKQISKDELLQGSQFDFSGFISTRHSIRMFQKTPIGIDEIKRVVSIANNAPSACNRQPCKVYFCNEEKKVQVIDSLITGSNGFKGEIPNYVVVTADRAQFMQEEQFQWYINGGIYISYLTLAMHSAGIGSCIMQWKAFYHTEKELKALLGITDREAIIAVVGCGHFQDETKCICAQRKSVEDTLQIV